MSLHFRDWRSFSLLKQFNLILHLSVFSYYYSLLYSTFCLQLYPILPLSLITSISWSNSVIFLIFMIYFPSPFSFWSISHLCIYLSIHLFDCLFIYLFIYLFVYLFVHLSVHEFIIIIVMKITLIIVIIIFLLFSFF